MCAFLKLVRLFFGSLAVSVITAGTATAGLWEVISPLSSGYQSEAVAMSADGSVIVGSSGTAGGQRAFRWTSATGTQALPMPQGSTATWTWATDVSADGSVVVGYGGSNFGTRSGWEGLIWQDGATPTRLADAGSGIWLKGVSGDGATVVGTQQGVSAAALSQAFRWTSSTGMVPLSGPLYTGGSSQSDADGISKDGLVVVGDTQQTSSLYGHVGYRWTDATGMSALGDFSVNAASRDGSVVVGAMSTANGLQAYRWTEAAGAVPFAPFAPGYTSQALGVSGDGLTVVGFVEDTSTDLRQAFIWKDGMPGMRLLKDDLIERYGFESLLEGWTLTKAYAVSDDGRTIVGRGYSPSGTDEAWRAIRAPEPGTLALLLIASLGGLGYACRRRREGRIPTQ